MSASFGNKNIKRDSSSGYSGIEEHSAPVHAFLEYSTSLIFPFLFGLNLHWAGARLYEFELLWLIALAVPVGVVGGDFISGIVHWAADTYCSEDTPVVGPSLVKPFRMHHVYPRDICTHNVVEPVGTVCILAVPLLSVSLLLLWLLRKSAWRPFGVIGLGLLADVQ